MIFTWTTSSTWGWWLITTSRARQRHKRGDPAVSDQVVTKCQHIQADIDSSALCQDMWSIRRKNVYIYASSCTLVILKVKIAEVRSTLAVIPTSSPRSPLPWTCIGLVSLLLHLHHRLKRQTPEVKGNNESLSARSFLPLPNHNLFGAACLGWNYCEEPCSIRLLRIR